MKVVVTGATGFIGSHVVPELLAGDHGVRILARPSSDLSELPPRVEAVQGNLTDAAAAMDGAEGLVHLVGIGGSLLRRSDGDGGELRRVNVEGTRHVFDAARRAGVRRAVLVTSMWTVLRPDLAARSPYVRSRLDSEQVAFDAGAEDMETVVLCPTFVVGPRDRGPNLPGSMVLAPLRHPVPMTLPGGMTWIAVEDVARQVLAALERGARGERYLLGAEHLSWLELFGLAARAAGTRPPRRALPRPIARAAAWLGDAGLAVAGRRSPISLRDGVDLLCLHEPVDHEAASRALGEPTVPIRVAVSQAVEWFREHGYARRRAHLTTS